LITPEKLQIFDDGKLISIASRNHVQDDQSIKLERSAINNISMNLDIILASLVINDQ